MTPEMIVQDKIAVQDMASHKRFVSLTNESISEVESALEMHDETSSNLNKLSKHYAHGYHWIKSGREQSKRGELSGDS